MASSLRERGCRLLAVDFDPVAVQRYGREGYAVHYGDAEAPEFVASLPLARIQWVVSTVRDPGINRMLLHALREQSYSGKVAISTSSQYDAKLFEKMENVDMVLVPYNEAAKVAAARLFPLAGE
jgi:Trk K+ transport system NAD-binding subunit